MNMIFETYANVYRTAMFQRSLHHEPQRLSAEWRRQKVKNDV